MRPLLVVLLITTLSNVFGQSLNSPNDFNDCELLTLKTIKRIENEFKSSQSDTFNVIVNDWIKQCGISEFTQRIIVLKNIKDEKLINIF